MTEARRRVAGFSLIEMLVALVILSISLAVLYQSLAGATRNLRVSAEYSDALILAESLMSQSLHVTEVGVTETGRFDQFDWRASAQPYELSASDTADEGSSTMARVVVTVSWNGEAAPRRLQLVTYTPIVASGAS